jgi:hypothetical protein
VILGRPFLATANALINCRTGVMKISFSNMTVELDIFDINKKPRDCDEIGSACLIEEIIEEAVEASSLEDPLEACIAQFGEDLDLDKLLEKADAILESATLVSSEEETTVSEPTKKEPKPRLDNLEYEFLGPADCLLVSIASELISVQEKKVLDVLREHKEAIGWTIEDTEQQRRLNPAIQEVEKAEVIIHPIFDSKCVSSIHVMPKWA